MKIRFARSADNVTEYILTPTTAEDGFELRNLYHKDQCYTEREPDGLSIRIFIRTDWEATKEAKDEYNKRKIGVLSKREWTYEFRETLIKRQVLPIGFQYPVRCIVKTLDQIGYVRLSEPIFNETDWHLKELVLLPKE